MGKSEVQLKSRFTVYKTKLQVQAVLYLHEITKSPAVAKTANRTGCK